MNKQELLNKLTTSEELIKTAFVPVSEVIKWVTELEESSIDLKELEYALADEIESEGLDLINDYELTMSYREVELDSIDISSSSVKDAVKRAIETVTRK